jgi:hypothetical protein
MAMVLASVVACRAQLADLGGPDPCKGDAEAAASSCRYTGPYSDGSGPFAGVPHYCGDPDGVQLASSANVGTAIVGVWAACGMSGPYPGSQAAGVQLGSDGKFVLLDQDSNFTFQPSSDPGRSGTFALVDASSSLGSGTFQIRFTAANGGVSLVQVVVLGSPPRLRFFTPTPTDFVPALTWAFRAAVCGPQFGPPATCDSSDNLLARMQGCWIWCSGPDDSPLITQSGPSQVQPTPVGLEVTGTQWTLLFEDSRGTVVPDPERSGTLQLNSDGPYRSIWRNGGSQVLDPESPMIDACGRAMLLRPTGVCKQGETVTEQCVGPSCPCPLDPSRSGLFVRAP